MMKQLNKKLAVYAALAWLFTVIALATRLLARLFSYDADIGYFVSGAILPTLHYIALILLVLLAVSALVVFRKMELPQTVTVGMKESSVAERIASVIGIACMALLTIASVTLYFITGIITPNLLAILAIVFGVASIFFFVFFCIPSRRGTTVHLLCGFAFVVYFLCILASSYFELYTQMNSPVKYMVQLTSVAAVFYLLTDLRFYMNNARPTRFIFSSICLLAFSTVSVFSGFFFSVVHREYTILYHIYIFAHIAILVFASVRIMRFLSLCAKADSESECNNDGALPTESDSPEEEASNRLTSEGPEVETLKTAKAPEEAAFDGNDTSSSL